jgi:hypothetical protein
LAAIEMGAGIVAAVGCVEDYYEARRGRRSRSLDRKWRRWRGGLSAARR